LWVRFINIRSSICVKEVKKKKNNGNFSDNPLYLIFSTSAMSNNLKRLNGTGVGIDSYAFGGVSDSGIGLIPDSAPTGDASASVDILTCGDVIVDGQIRSHAWIYDTSEMYLEEYFGDTSADVIVKAYGDVIVNSEPEVVEEVSVENLVGPGGQILAEANNGKENSADITILAVGDVIVNDGHGGTNSVGEIESSGVFGPDEIRAAAHDGYTNSAHVGIATRPGDDGDITVDGQIGAHTWNAREESDPPSSNTSNVEICADQDVIVNGGYALYGFTDNPDYPGPMLLESEEGGQILAEAIEGFENTANVEIYAGRDVIVHGAEVEFMGPPPAMMMQPIPIVSEYDGGQILALAQMGIENTANIGIYAQGDVTIHDADVTGEPPIGNTQVANNDSLYDGQVLAAAMMGTTNTAEIEICAQDDVTVDGLVGAIAGMGKEENSAHIDIAAGNADPGGPGGGGIAGSGHIGADADVDQASITFYVTSEDNFNFTGTMIPEREPLVIGPVTCPDCDFEWIDWTWCVDCEPAPLIEPAPISTFALPLDEPVEFGPGGCPLRMMWLADELGVGVDIQVVVANAYAYSTDCQPCDAAARLHRMLQP